MKKDVMIPCTEVGSLWAVASDPVGVLVVLLLFAVTQIECATNLPSENTEGFGNFRAERVFRTMVDSHVNVTAKSIGCLVVLHCLPRTWGRMVNADGLLDERPL